MSVSNIPEETKENEDRLAQNIEYSTPNKAFSTPMMPTTEDRLDLDHQD